MIGSRKDSRAVAPEDLARGCAAIETALERGGDRLTAGQRVRAEALVSKVRERTGLAGTRTVVALAGATGSGKSSLFNALVTEPVARIGARRPTTSRPTAAIWGEDGCGPLLDWLGVGARHQVPAGAAHAERLDGLVLLDLPDFDSRVEAHRKEADRILQLADVLVLVTDPQKYADAVLHEDYLRRLSAYSAVTLVVLNQVDRLPVEAVEECARDLQRLLADDGLSDVPVIPTSAVRGVGVPDLLDRVSQAVQGKNAAAQRLMADVRAQAVALRAEVADGEVDLRAERVGDDLVTALGRAAGVPTVVDAVQRDFRREAARRCGWPFLRWVHALRPAPLRRLGLAKIAQEGLSRKDARLALGRSSLPEPTPAARAAVDVATRRVGQQASAGLPDRWAQAVHAAATPKGADLYDDLDQAVLGTKLQGRDPRWWVVAWALQWVFAAAAVVGLLWLVVLAALGFGQIHVSPPSWGPLPAPLVLLVGGVLLGLVLALLARWLAAQGARRRGHAVRRRLDKAVAATSGEKIIQPVQRVLADHAATRAALDEVLPEPR